MMRTISLISAVFVTTSAGSALATPVVTFEEDAFLSANPITVTDDFSVAMTFPAAQKTVAFDQVQFTSIDVASPSWVVADGPSVGARLFRRYFSSTADVRLDFENSAYATAFGFRLVAFGYPNQFALAIVDWSGATTSVTLPPNTTNTYIGIADFDGVASVTLTQHPEVADGVITNFGFASFARSDLFTDTVISRPKVTAWSVSFVHEACSVRGATLVLNASTTSDGKILANPNFGTPVTVWNAQGHVKVSTILGSATQTRRLHGNVVCVANLGPASALTADGDPNSDLWEVRAEEQTSDGVRYRSYLLQDTGSGDYFGYEVTTSSDAYCGQLFEARLVPQTWGYIVVHQ